jgi:hypothetical protein
MGASKNQRFFRLRSNGTIKCDSKWSCFVAYKDMANGGKTTVMKYNDTSLQSVGVTVSVKRILI